MNAKKATRADHPPQEEGGADPGKREVPKLCAPCPGQGHAQNRERATSFSHVRADCAWFTRAYPNEEGEHFAINESISK